MNDNDIVEPNVGPGAGAVSLFGAGAAEDFPVLKAFQQYIDAEQEKARKRLTMICLVFAALFVAVVSFFVVMLRSDGQQLQKLNDRLIEYAMKDRERSSAVVVQPQTDNAALLQLTSKIEEMQRKMLASEKAAEASERARAAAESARAAAERKAVEAAKPKEPTPEETEIARLKAQLAAEKAKTAENVKLRREAELEAYRRKHYPELYEPQPKVIVVREPAVEQPAPRVRSVPKKTVEVSDEELTDDDAISYFGVEEDGDGKGAKKKGYTIPVEVKGSSTSTTTWRIPND